MGFVINHWMGIVAFATASILLYLLYEKQDYIVYPSYIPTDSRTSFLSPQLLGLGEVCQEVFIPTPDGETLQIYECLQPQPKEHKTILFFHGNAGNLSHRLPNILQFYMQCKLNVLIVSYRGYGKSTGIPSEGGLQIDAKASYQYMIQHPKINREQCYLFGRSLGGAVAIYLASQVDDQQVLRGIMIENTFTSIPHMASKLFYVLRWVEYWLKSKWNSQQAIQQISIPILFLSGRQDTLVPPTMMDTLYQAANSATKVFVPFEHGEHMDTNNQVGYIDAINNFLS